MWDIAMHLSTSIFLYIYVVLFKCPQRDKNFSKYKDINHFFRSRVCYSEQQN